MEFTICSRAEDKTGEELKSQVMLGTGFPKVAQLKSTNEPDFTVWSLRPRVIRGVPAGGKGKQAYERISFPSQALQALFLHRHRYEK